MMIFKDGQLGKHSPSDNVAWASRPFLILQNDCGESEKDIYIRRNTDERKHRL
jgi:hypothetical protein